MYGYWNEGGSSNIMNMLIYLCNEYFTDTGLVAEPVTTTPPTGCLHPAHKGFFADASEYMAWYRKEGPLRGTQAPIVAVLLYRKHVITRQPYIAQLVQQMEADGLIPIPIFINGVEAHTIVRDQITSAGNPLAQRAQSRCSEGSQAGSHTGSRRTVRDTHGV